MLNITIILTTCGLLRGDILKINERCGPGRRHIGIDKKRRPFSTLLDPSFHIHFQEWCIKNDISQGRAFETIFLIATDNFEKDLTLF